VKKIYCKNCGRELSEDDDFCPNCGSKEKIIELKLEDEAQGHEQIGLKAKENGAKKPFQESVSGDDLYRKSGKWCDKERKIDRKNNSYREIIKDKTTGEIIHKCEEPLSKHKGHGSAKHKKKSETNED